MLFCPIGLYPTLCQENTVLIYCNFLKMFEIRLDQIQGEDRNFSTRQFFISFRGSVSALQAFVELIHEAKEEVRNIKEKADKMRPPPTSGSKGRSRMLKLFW